MNVLNSLLDSGNKEENFLKRFLVDYRLFLVNDFYFVKELRRQEKKIYFPFSIDTREGQNKKLQKIKYQSNYEGMLVPK